MILKIHIDNPAPRTINKAVEALRNGGVIIYPTDTVYGIGCSIEDVAAIEKIHLIKQQRKDKPFSFVCSDLSHISEYAHVDNQAFKLMKRLIPGPYTFILPAQRMKHLPKILVSKRKTVGIRVPASQPVQALINALGNPILSTSVSGLNGTILNDPDDIIAHMKDRVEMILDGGALVSEPSTIIDLTGDEPQVLREGSGLDRLLDVVG